MLTVLQFIYVTNNKCNILDHVVDGAWSTCALRVGMSLDGVKNRASFGLDNISVPIFDVISSHSSAAGSTSNAHLLANGLASCDPDLLMFPQRRLELDHSGTFVVDQDISGVGACDALLLCLCSPNPYPP
jgi:hypothetical protein